MIYTVHCTAPNNLIPYSHPSPPLSFPGLSHKQSSPLAIILRYLWQGWGQEEVGIDTWTHVLYSELLCIVILNCFLQHTNYYTVGTSVYTVSHCVIRLPLPFHMRYGSLATALEQLQLYLYWNLSSVHDRFWVLTIRSLHAWRVVQKLTYFQIYPITIFNSYSSKSNVFSDYKVQRSLQHNDSPKLSVNKCTFVPEMM